MIDEEVASFLGEVLLARYPMLLAQRYKVVPDALDGPALIEAIGRHRGCRIKGGGLDLEKAAQILLLDYRSGALGRITLETPTSRSAMLDAARDALEAARAEPEV